MVRLVQVTLFPACPFINKVMDVVSVEGIVMILVYVVGVVVKGNVNPTVALMTLIEILADAYTVKVTLYLVFARKRTGTVETTDPDVVERVKLYSPFRIAGVPPTGDAVNVGA